MPVRANRGRAAIYRKVWGWPLRSPWHALTAGVAFALVLGVAGLIAGIGERAGPGAGGQTLEERYVQEAREAEQRGQRDPRYSGTDATSFPSSSAPPRAPAAADAAKGPSMKSPETIAREFAARWVRPAEPTSNDAWRESLRPYTTDAFLTRLASVDPANVPATRVTGSPVVVDRSKDSIHVDVPTDALILRLRVDRTGDGWQVADYTRADGG